jgi:Polyketide cyclase / dehydrase and lipid transport
MGKLDIKESIKVDTSAEKAWKIIGPNFLTIADWGRGINKSWDNDSIPASIEGAPAGGRFCDLGKFGIADEQIVHYNEAQKEITWTAKSKKLPGFLIGLQNTLKVELIDENSCHVTTNITANLTGVRGLLLGAAIKNNFTKLLKGFVKDWKTYAETGKVSDTKQRELDKILK